MKKSSFIYIIIFIYLSGIQGLFNDNDRQAPDVTTVPRHIRTVVEDSSLNVVDVPPTRAPISDQQVAELRRIFDPLSDIDGADLFRDVLQYISGVL